MNPISTASLIESLKAVSPLGLEVVLVKGVLRSTKTIYLRENFVFTYTNEFRFDFNPNDAEPISVFEKNYSSVYWLVEQEVG
ncbi:MAG: hypothetical protein E6Q38_03915 [Crocinitomicaceae bacterium]|nr:MAG: hypothetical protein E6Q38_03915 [Crocinitomicaceae bacterium]